MYIRVSELTLPGGNNSLISFSVCFFTQLFILSLQLSGFSWKFSLFGLSKLLLEMKRKILRKCSGGGGGGSSGGGGGGGGGG